MQRARSTISEQKLVEAFDPTAYKHTVKVERMPHQCTNVYIDGKLWGAILDGDLIRLCPSGDRIGQWAQRVISRLLELIESGEDIWSDEMQLRRYEFLCSCSK